jgi:hypothetical protein
LQVCIICHAEINDRKWREEIRRDVIGRNFDGRRFARFSVAKIRRRSFQIPLHDAHPLR